MIFLQAVTPVVAVVCVQVHMESSGTMATFSKRQTKPSELRSCFVSVII